MSVTSERITAKTNEIIKESLLNGEIPDELVVEEKLYEQLGDFYDPDTDSYTINEPLWIPADLGYRTPADVSKWNATQGYAVEDLSILYRDMIKDAKTLTDKLSAYMMTSSLLRVRINKLLGRIENLLLLANSTEGFLYSFFDTFNDKSKVSYDDDAKTTAMVNVDHGQVELARKNDTDVTGIDWKDGVLNLQFLQNRPTEVSFSVLNTTLGITSLSTAELSDIFNNKSVAWQREITTASSGALVAQLTVRVSPMDPVPVNRVEIQTKMSNYNSQLQIQTFYSQDGVSYIEVPSPSNPQYVTQSAAINFNTIYATHFRFLITKSVPDSGHTFILGFQSINFLRTQYNDEVDGNEIYSIPITFPDTSRPIGKVACEVCESKPTGTNIDYYIVVAGNNGETNYIPITPTNNSDTSHSKIIDLGSLGSVDSNISTTSISGYHQWAEASGRLYIDASTLTEDVSGVIDMNFGDTIAQTLEIYRGIGFPSPSGNNLGFKVPPYGLGEDYWLTNVLVENEGGSSIDFGQTSAIVDGKKVSGSVLLDYGMHQIATKDLSQHQEKISGYVDKYFAYNMRYVSPFEFYNDYDSDNLGVFTYDTETGNIIMNQDAIASGVLEVDYDKSFIKSEREDKTYLTSEIQWPDAQYIATAPSGLANGGGYVDFKIDASGNPHWVNEVQLTINTSTSTSIRVLSSADGINFIQAGEDITLPTPGIELFGALRFDKPVFCRYVRIYFITGSNIDITSTVYKIFPPIFKETGTIYTEPIYLPAGHTWDKIVDNCVAVPTQEYTAYRSPLDESHSGPYTEDLSTCNLPKFYFKITGSEPYVDLVYLRSIPVTDERSTIKFAFHSLVNTESHKSIRFKAVLSSDNKDITPKLESYRVKLA